MATLLHRMFGLKKSLHFLLPFNSMAASHHEQRPTTQETLMSLGKFKILASLTASLLLSFASVGSAASLSGNPAADGWALLGHSLENGVYSRGAANYGFNIYSAEYTVAAGSDLEIADGANSWLVGDTVLGLGGTFAGITAGDAGWGAFTGNGVNSILGNETKLTAKFGTSTAAFTSSSIAPDAGNGNGSGGVMGTGGVTMRTSGWNSLSDNAAWIAGDGVLQPVSEASHISRNGGTINRFAGRMIWEWDAANEVVVGWQLLLNTSLANRIDPSLAASTPVLGDMAIASVQFHDAAYTDALVNTAAVPEPAALTLAAMGLFGAVAARRRK